jgi:hypothetical protein
MRGDVERLLKAQRDGWRAALAQAQEDLDAALRAALRWRERALAAERQVASIRAGADELRAELGRGEPGASPQLQGRRKRRRRR